MTVGVEEVHAPATVVGVDLTGHVAVGIGPVGQVAFPEAAEDRVELVLADEEGVVLDLDGLVTVRKSSDTPLSASTTRKGPKATASGRPMTSDMNRAAAAASVAATIVWFSSTGMRTSRDQTSTISLRPGTRAPAAGLPS